MKKKINSLKTSLLLLTWLFGVAVLQAQQTGINTKNPQTVLHVDAKKDNSPVIQEADDFVVTSSGNVGIGTISPTHKLDIRGKIQIIDGGQQVGSVLTSNASGLAIWNHPAVSKTIVNGVYPATSSDILPDGYTNPPKDSGISITLSRGKWIVNAGLTFLEGNITIFQRCYLSSANNVLQQNGFTFLGPAGTQSSYGGIVATNIYDKTSPGQRGFVTGSMAIEVTAPSVRIYLLLQNQPSGAYKFNANNYLENYFFAKPID